jgi:hypothetical protein
MKKIFSTAFAGSFLILVASIVADGQIAKTNVELPGDIPSFEKVRSENASNVADRKDVNEKAVRNFSQSFKTAKEIWYIVKNGFAAGFSAESIDYLVTYDNKGNWLHTVRTYNEAKMSKDLRNTIKSNYYDYEINVVNEIASPAAPTTYIVQLVGKTKLINLRIVNGDIEEWQKFDKSE